ncbi:MAG: T9SS type A sorting domain-containing protein, partial [Bacteroidota bacterium]
EATDLFSVHPNPIEDDQIVMEVGSDYLNQTMVLEVFDATGKLVQFSEIQPSVNTLSVEASFKSGIYTVRLTAGQFTHQVRVVK